MYYSQVVLKPSKLIRLLPNNTNLKSVMVQYGAITADMQPLTSTLQPKRCFLEKDIWLCNLETKEIPHIRSHLLLNKLFCTEILQFQKHFRDYYNTFGLNYIITSVKNCNWCSK
ncbi:unnamed protein product [Moneuplotes crassus]|uniref:Uncharacterized protein n=1 Tax=Euplotes crassus TaxID=5936 RepID=A0AAD1XWW8_EUPCR|nr:unnamed protein product [Moneuplotes crassus]